MSNTTCRGCKGQKTRNQIVCKACWQSMPAGLRSGWHHAGEIEAKRKAARNILDHFNGTPSML